MKKLLLTLAAIGGLAGYARAEGEGLAVFTPQDRSGWTITGCSQHNAKGDGADGGFAEIMDDNTATFWHSEWSNTDQHNTTCPHYFVVDRGENAGEFTGFGYLPRQHSDGNGFVTSWRLFGLSSIEGLQTAGDNNTIGQNQQITDQHASLQTLIESVTPIAQGTFDIVHDQVATHGLRQVRLDAANSSRYALFVIDGVSSSAKSNGIDLHANCAEFYLYDVTEDTSADAFVNAATPILTKAQEVVEGWKGILPSDVYSTLKTQVSVEPSTITTNAALEEITNTCNNAVNTAYEKANGKVIYMYNHRSRKYFTANTDGSNRVQSVKNELAKWLVVRNGSNNSFRLMNVETLKDIADAPGSQANHGGGRLFEIGVSENDNPGTALKYADTTNGMTIGGTDNIDNWGTWTQNDGGASWTLSLTGSTVSELDTTGNSYYRIRSARALWRNQASLVGINTVVEDGAEAGADQILRTRHDGLGALWTINAASGGKVYIRNAAADFQGNDTPYAFATTQQSTYHTGSSIVNNDNAIEVSILAAQGAPQSTFAQGYPQALCVQTYYSDADKYYLDNENGGDYLPKINGWDRIDNNFPNNGGVYYFELAEDADEVIEAYKTRAAAISPAIRANGNVDYITFMAPNVPALYGGIDTEALSALKVAFTITDVKTANAANNPVEGLEDLTAALAAVDDTLATRWFAVRNMNNQNHVISLATGEDGTSTPRCVESAQGATVNALNNVWKLMPAGNNTYKLYNYGVHKNLGHKAAITTAVEFEDVDAGSAYTMERGQLWDRVNSVAFRMPENAPNGMNLLFNDSDNTRLTTWSTLSEGNTGAQWVIELIDFEPAKSVTVGGYKDETEGWKLTFTAENLVKTENMGAHHSLVYGNTPAEAEVQSEENGLETYALEGETSVAPDDSRISVENGVATLTLDLEPGDYTLKVPAGFFTVNNKLSEPFTANVTLNSDGTVTSIGEIKAVSDSEAEYFDLNGRKVVNPAGGIFIVRKGEKVAKQVIR